MHSMTARSAARRARGRRLTALGLACLATLAVGGAARAEPRTLATGAFEFTNEITVPGTPEAAFDLFTGDVSPWWDHHFVDKPKKLYIEPKPGGGFYEIIDDAGNGVQHARVIYAMRGRALRMVGPLSLSGNAIDLVCSLDFERAGDAETRVRLTVRGAGQMEDEWPAKVESAWHHFLVERFRPYAAAKLGG